MLKHENQMCANYENKFFYTLYLPLAKIAGINVQSRPVIKVFISC